jgi:hypothetical protein
MIEQRVKSGDHEREGVADAPVQDETVGIDV